MRAEDLCFTIIMPTRNHARWIEEAVRSVLDQDFQGRVELIVFDALSDDGTAAVLERYRDRLVWQRGADRGQVDVINRGLSTATGDIVTWLNSDDAFLPGALRRVAETFAADSSLGFVYGDALEIDENSRILTPNLFTEDCVAERYLYSHNFMCQPTVFMRRAVPARVGPLREDLRWFMDYEWFSRFYKTGLKGTRLPHFLAANRDHPATKTNSGGFARWFEAMRVFSSHPGPFVLTRRSIWIYSLEFAIKSLNAAGWAAPPALPPSQRSRQQKTVDWLNGRLMSLINPHSFDDIVRRFSAEISPRGGSVPDLWRHL
jgi:glycosyltransferase involved in cell wall biosynthesis